MTDFPNYVDTIVIGGGTTGAVVAGRLAGRSTQNVLLLEAGPDYGAYSDGRWPADLLNARALALSHDWNYTHAGVTGRPAHPLERARVIGGCSAHNGCIAIWGHRADYDDWAALGNDGWSTDELLPFFRTANEMLRVRQYAQNDITPFHEACLEAIEKSGVPGVDDLNNLDDDAGAGIAPVNTVGAVRWNAAFAYLDPVRHNPNLRILGNVMVDQLRVANGRAVAVEIATPNGPILVEAGRIVLCAGAYGSPAILLRSGIGHADELRALGIVPVLDRPGVGGNLHDHPSLYLQYSGTPKVIEASQSFVARGGTLFAEQSLAKFRSAHCSAAFDLHLFPVGGLSAKDSTQWEFILPVGNMKPKSRGRLRLHNADPSSAPLIDTGYLTDPDDDDLEVLMSGLEIVRGIARQSPLAELLGEEIAPSIHYTNRDAVRRDCLHYYHPVGTCKMGPAGDSSAVVDARGQVHGIENLYVADASIMPRIPRANTNIPTIVVAERIASWLLK